MFDLLVLHRSEDRSGGGGVLMGRGTLGGFRVMFSGGFFSFVLLFNPLFLLALGLHLLKPIPIGSEDQIDVLKHGLPYLPSHALPQAPGIGDISQFFIIEVASIRGLDSIGEGDAYPS